MLETLGHLIFNRHEQKCILPTYPHLYFLFSSYSIFFGKFPYGFQDPIHCPAIVNKFWIPHRNGDVQGIEIRLDFFKIN